MRAPKFDIEHDHAVPLVVRASLPRTFLGLGMFAVITLLFFGAYLISESLQKPLEADQTSILLAGLILALASVLLYYLLQPLRRPFIADPDAAQFRASPNAGPLMPLHQSAQRKVEDDQGEALPGSM